VVLGEKYAATGFLDFEGTMGIELDGSGDVTHYLEGRLGERDAILDPHAPQRLPHQLLDAKPHKGSRNFLGGNRSGDKNGLEFIVEEKILATGEKGIFTGTLNTAMHE
jgi:hypothetical protein